MKKIAIITINYHSEKETEECIKSLEKIKTKDFAVEAIVINNSPEEPKNSLNDILKKSKNIKTTLINPHENTGYSGGNNLGITHALKKGSDYVLLLNNDTRVKSDFLISMVGTIESDSKIAIVTSKIYFEKGHEFHKARYSEKDLGKVIWYAGGEIDWDNVLAHHRGVDEVDKGQYDKTEQTEYANGACMLMRKEMIEDIGMFDERYFLYYEDSDLSMRTKNAGFKIIYEPSAVIYHKNASSSGGSGSGLQDYYTTRNRLLFASKYAPLRAKIALTKESILLLLKGRKFQKKGAKDFYLRKFGKADFHNK